MSIQWEMLLGVMYIMIIIKNIKINKKEEKIKIKGNERKGMDDVSA